MANSPKFDISKLTPAELADIQHALLRAVATRAHGGVAEAGHDSHGSVHSKNAIMSDVLRRNIERGPG